MNKADLEYLEQTFEFIHNNAIIQNIGKNLETFGNLMMNSANIISKEISEQQNTTEPKEKPQDEALHIPVVSNRIYTPEFIEWIGVNYIRLNEVWVHIFNNQNDKENWRTTEWVYDYWKEQNGY